MDRYNKTDRKTDGQKEVSQQERKFCYNTQMNITPNL